jgi:GNAT superfamily N-acetyltransferase
MHVIDRIDAAGMSHADARRVAALVTQAWPREQMSLDEVAETLSEQWRDYDGPAEIVPRYLVISNEASVQSPQTAAAAKSPNGPLVAIGLVQPRTIASSHGTMTILALARVCVTPDRRGEGLGEAIARQAFNLVDDGTFDFALFQTTPEVRAFYEKLGACLVKNKLINSTAPDPKASAFWDPVVMRYPAGSGWPEGTIDLLGPGY